MPSSGDSDVVLRLRLDGAQALESDLRAAQQALGQLSRGAGGANPAVAALRQELIQLAASARGVGSVQLSTDAARQQLAALRTQIAAQPVTINAQVNTEGVAAKLEGLAAGAFGVGTAQKIIQLSDEYQTLSARLRLTSANTQEFTTKQAALNAIAQDAGQPLSAVYAIYNRSAKALQDLGLSTQQQIQYTKAVGDAFKASGASGEEAAGAIIQFSQAIGSGTLRGDEFNSVNENGHRLITALADGLGVAESSLRAMAEAGQLNANIVIPALLSQSKKLNDEAHSLGETFAQTAQKAVNSFQIQLSKSQELQTTLAAAKGGVNLGADNLGQAADVVSQVSVISQTVRLAKSAFEEADAASQGFLNTLERARDRVRAARGETDAGAQSYLDLGRNANGTSKEIDAAAIAADVAASSQAELGKRTDAVVDATDKLIKSGAQVPLTLAKIQAQAAQLETQYDNLTKAIQGAAAAQDFLKGLIPSGLSNGKGLDFGLPDLNRQRDGLKVEQDKLLILKQSTVEAKKFNDYIDNFATKDQQRTAARAQAQKLKDAAGLGPLTAGELSNIDAKYADKGAAGRASAAARRAAAADRKESRSEASVSKVDQEGLKTEEQALDLSYQKRTVTADRYYGEKARLAKQATDAQVAEYTREAERAQTTGDKNVALAKRDQAARAGALEQEKIAFQQAETLRQTTLARVTEAANVAKAQIALEVQANQQAYQSRAEDAATFYDRQSELARQAAQVEIDAAKATLAAQRATLDPQVLASREQEIRLLEQKRDLATQGAAAERAPTLAADGAAKASEAVARLRSEYDGLSQTVQAGGASTVEAQEKFRASLKAAQPEILGRIEDLKLLAATAANPQQAAAIQQQIGQISRDYQSLALSARSPMEVLLAQWKDTAGQMQQVAVTFTEGFADALTDLATKGKANFADLANGIIRSLVRIAIQAAITRAITAAIGGYAVNVPSQQNYSQLAPAESMVTAPRFATGGVIQGPGTGTSDSILARVSNGESILTAAATKAIGAQQVLMWNRMGRNARGYATGGIIGSSSQPMPSTGPGQGSMAPIVNIIGAPSTPQVSSRQDKQGRPVLDLIFDGFKDRLAADTRRGGVLYQATTGRAAGPDR